MSNPARIILFITSGVAEPEVYLEAAKAEAPVRGRARACKACPLRRGGEWEAGATAAMAEMTTPQRSTMRRRWGCHEGDRPCAGMARIVRSA